MLSSLELNTDQKYILTDVENHTADPPTHTHPPQHTSYLSFEYRVEWKLTNQAYTGVFCGPPAQQQKKKKKKKKK